MDFLIVALLALVPAMMLGLALSATFQKAEDKQLEEDGVLGEIGDYLSQ